MKRIEYFCRNMRHHDPIEDQMREAREGGIIKAYTLTTLSAMNARRNADICLWCDEIWSPDHIHSCLHVPDHNCVFTCGEDFEIFAFVKVAKEGLKHVVVNSSQGEELIHCAEKVFDVMGDTNLGISSKEAITSGAPQVFDEMPLPDFIREMAEATKLDDFHDGVDGVLVQPSDCASSKGLQTLNSSILFDAMSGQILGSYQGSNALFYNENTLKQESSETFSCENEARHDHELELVLEKVLVAMNDPCSMEIAKAVEDDYALTNDNAYGDCDDFSNLEQQIFGKLSAFVDPCFRDTVIICASIERFSTIWGLLVDGCQFSTQSLDDDNKFSGEMFSPKCLFFHQVSIKPFMSNETYSVNLMKHVVCTLILNDMNWFMESNLSTILGLEVHNAWMFTLENGQRTFLSFKEVHSWGFDPVVDLPHMKLTVGNAYFIPLLDPDHELKVERMISEECTWELVAFFCFDPGGLWACDFRDDEDGLLPELSLLSDISYFRLGVFVLAFMAGNVVSGMSIEVLIFIPTLEDKGDFKGEGVYAMSTYTIWATVSNVICPKEYIESMNIAWDPGIIHKIVYEQFRVSNVSRVGCQKHIILLELWLLKCWAANSWISDVGAIGFVNFDYMSKVHKISEMLFVGTIKHRSILMKFMKQAFFFLLCISAMNAHEHQKMTADGKVFTFEYVSKHNSTKDCWLIISGKVYDVAPFMEDPVGNDYGQEMMHRLNAYQSGGNRFSEKSYKDFQCYVFDPGGPLTRLIIDAMVTNPRLVLCYVMSWLMYHLSLILEDKDHFKRPVLIHT